MIPGTLAKRYARALLDLADTPVKRDKFEKDLNAVGAASEVEDDTNTPLAVTLEAGRYPLSQRRARLKRPPRYSFDGSLLPQPRPCA